MTRSLFALAAMAALLAAPALAQEPKLEEILEKHYEAIGGLEAWNGVTTAKMVGNMSSPGGFEAPFTMVFKRPDKSRLDFTFQGMTGTQAVDGDVAWQIMPFMGKPDPEEMSGDQAKLVKEQADFDGPLVNYEEDGNKIEYVGIENVEGSDTHHLEVTLASGDVRHYYLDVDYFLPIKVEAKTVVQGQEQEIEVVYGDYKEVGGLMMAHSIENKPKGAPAGQVITIDSAELNVELSDDVFEMPKTEAKAEG